MTEKVYESGGVLVDSFFSIKEKCKCFQITVIRKEELSKYIQLTEKEFQELLRECMASITPAEIAKEIRVEDKGSDGYKIIIESPFDIEISKNGKRIDNITDLILRLKANEIPMLTMTQRMGIKSGGD